MTPDPRWSWFFTVAGVTGLLLITHKNRWGMALGCLKELVWIVYALATHQPGFIVSGAVFAVIFANGFRCWARPEPEPVEGEVAR